MRQEPGPDRDPRLEPVYLTGPTASGKTAVGVALARLLRAEVIALDSMTVYRGMDVGTAKPTLGEREGIPHHLLDVLDPWEAASVADYRARALAIVDRLRSEGRRALFVGGTPLYLKAMLRGLFDGPGADPSLRDDLEREAGPGTEGDLLLHDRLARLDPGGAARLPVGDRRRVIRALEVFTLTGRPIASFRNEHDAPATGTLAFAIARPRPVLVDRIDRRAAAMFAGGLVDEVRRLLDAPKPIGETARQGAGYLETIAMLEGDLSEAEALVRTQARSRQLAKRQSTWFRGLAEIRPIPVGDYEHPEAVAERLLRLVEAGG